MSTSAGTPEPSDGQPPRPSTPRRDLRDSLWGRAAILGVLLLFTLVVSRTCASQDQEVSQEEAIELAVESVGFEPCSEAICVQIRYLQRGIPIRGYWLVGLARDVDDTGEPIGAKSVLVDVETGEVSAA